jgi:hypothetical protein
VKNALYIFYGIDDFIWLHRWLCLFIQDKKLKETFPTIPSLEDLQTLEADGLKADIIIVDTERDKKIFMLKQLSAALVKGLNSSPALVIKKIAGLVSYN